MLCIPCMCAFLSRLFEQTISGKNYIEKVDHRCAEIENRQNEINSVSGDSSISPLVDTENLPFSRERSIVHLKRSFCHTDCIGNFSSDYAN